MGSRPTTRYEEISVAYRDMNWKAKTIHLSGFPAQICQHEMDHLVGKLFIDYLSPLKQQRIRQKVEKLDRMRARA